MIAPYASPQRRRIPRLKPQHFIFSIRARLLLLIAFLFFILGFSGYFLQSTLNASLKIIDRQTSAIQTLQDTTIAGKSYTTLRWSYLTFLSRPTRSNLKVLNTKLDLFENSLAPLKSSPLKGDVVKIEAIVEHLRSTSAQLADTKRNSERAQTLEMRSTEQLSRIDEILNGFVTKLEGLLSDSAAQTRHQTAALNSIPVIFIIGGFLTIIFASVIGIIQLFIPISRITRAMTAASLDAPNARRYVLPVPGRDELGQATAALNSLFHEVSDGIEQVQQTERQLRETGEYLQAVLDNVVDSIVTTDEDGTVRSVSPSAERLFHVSATDLIGTPFSNLVSTPDGAPFDLPAELSSEENSESMALNELLARLADGSVTPVEVTIGRAQFAGRRIFIVTLRDIAGRKQMENFLEQAQRMETIGRMTGGIAHDFNNMLTVISGNFELIGMRTKTDDPVLRSMIDMGLDTVKRGKDMTQRLLAISSRQLLKPEVLNLGQRLPAIVELLQHAVREHADVTSHAQDDIGNIRVDPVQLESALLNLSINAKDALPPTGGQIHISIGNITLAEDSIVGTSIVPGPYVMISIADNGSGIPPEIADRVLEPFFTTKDDKGTGLGLSMVYGFTRQSGGYLTIDSAVDHGTIVTLFFPRSLDDVSAGDAESRKQLLAEEDVPGGSETIMVVEDEPDVLNYVTQTLKDLGYRVSQASDGASALQKLAEGDQFAMLLTDVVMPGGMNGEMLAEEATQRWPELKVLFMSGYTRDALIEQGSLKKGVTLLAKPFTRADLAHHIRGILDAA